MARTFVRPQAQIKKTNTYDDTKTVGASLETGQSNLADDLNALRSQCKRALWADESGNWYDDVPTHTAKKRGLDALNEDLNDIEVKTFLVCNANLIDVSVATGTKANGTLTLTGQPEEGHEAEGILEFTGNANNADTVTIGSKTYTFQDTLTDVDGNVKIGASASATIDNLIAGINLGAGAGTAYAASMTANADVAAATEFGDSMRVTALDKGTDPNSTATTETGDNLSWRDATLVNGTNAKRAGGVLTLASNFIGEVAATGTLTASANVSGGVAATQTLTLGSNLNGILPAKFRIQMALNFTSAPTNGSTITIDSTVYTFTNSVSSAYDVYIGSSPNSNQAASHLVTAINLTGTPGVEYGSGTAIHPTVSAVLNLSSAVMTIELTAKTAGAAGNAITVSDSGNYAWWKFFDNPPNQATPNTFCNGRDADTVTIDTKTYTFQETLTNVDGNVHIGGNASATLDNLIDAINLGSGAGTDYAAAMTVHPTVSAAAGAGDTMDITAKTGGTGGNSIEVDATNGDAYWTEWKLTGGAVGVKATGTITFDSNAVRGESARANIFGDTINVYDGNTVTIDGKTYTFRSSLTGYQTVNGVVLRGASTWISIVNLVAAINLASGSGTTYSSATTIHTTMGAAGGYVEGIRGFLRVAAKVPGYEGSGISLSDSSPWTRMPSSTTYLPTEGDSVTIDGETYIFVGDISSSYYSNQNIPNLVEVGATANVSINNLVYAITENATWKGTFYSNSTTAHSTVTASNGTGDTLDIEALSAGTGGNSIVFSVTRALGNLSIATDTMSGGGDGDTVTMDSKTYTFQDTLTDVNGNVKVGASASDSLDNLIAAVNLGAGAGTKYANSMTLHSTMSAAAGAGDTMDVTAKTAGTVGNSLDTTETGANLSWGGSTLSGGLNGETITIDAKVYTMTNSLTDVDGRVLIGAGSADSINNLVAAIGLLPGANSLYANSMTIHPTCLAEVGTGTSIDVSAKTGGTAGNSIATTETASNASFGGSTLSGGLAEETVTIDTKTYTFQSSLTDVDGNVKIGSDVDTTIANLVNAILLGPGTGTAYADSMTEHSTVTAAEGAGDTMTAAAKTAGTGGNSIATTETLANGSWGNSTLSGGTAGPGGEVNFVVLSKAAGEIPNLDAAVDAVLTSGMVVAYNSSFGAHSLNAVAGQTAISPKNICAIKRVSDGQRIYSGGKVVHALLQCEDNTDGHTFDDTSKRAMLSFVRENSTGDALEACPVADIDGEAVHYSYIERVDYDSIDESAFLNNYHDVVTIPAVDVNLNDCIDNQSGAATQAQDIDVDILDTKAWVFRDSAAADLFKVYGNAASSSTEVEIGSAVDIYDNNAADVDFHNGAAIGSAGTEIAINETAGVIERAANLILRASGSGELYLDDGNQPGSWAQTDGIKLSENETEWSDFETEFGGEVSLLKAITQASNAAARSIGTAVLQDDVSANNDVDATTTSNLDVDLPDYSGVTSFVTDVDVFLNGKLLNNGADAAANEDVYPGTTPAQGMLKFEFDLDGTSPNPDVLSMIVWGE